MDKEEIMRVEIQGIQIEVVVGDLTARNDDAIVNPANTHGEMGGGVAAAIKAKGGIEIEQEAMRRGPFPVGSAILTSGGNLPAGAVIHAATMGMDFKTDEEKVRAAAWSALELAQARGFGTLAFCALGCGTGKFPPEASSKVIAQEIYRYLHHVARPTLRRITVVVRTEEMGKIFERNVCGYLRYMHSKMFEGPFLTVDGIVRYQNGIVLVERTNPPFGWALPGGFVDYGESVEDAVVREIKEETSLDLVEYRQRGVFSSPGRDPRFHTVSVVFSGRGTGRLRASSDAKQAKVYLPDQLPEKIAFDHGDMIRQYLADSAYEK
ncbi:MAG: NUDIX domain-containing protein [Candidatus Omnitrophica bacterium]|nr:NUDIX domain-containing protein [Candidatus Omnitrophota bacterium]